jgi:dTDP-N-acetylfucosamine:lipid II N-acetylfucosaminyltransferase
MILHVADIEKFIEPFIGFLQDNFEDFERHVFFLFGDNGKYKVTKRENIRLAEEVKNRLFAYSDLLRLMYHADKIILHGLWNTHIVQMLSFNPWLLKKCYWVIWGGDLYAYKLSKRDKAWENNERYRRFVIKRLGHLVTYIEGDVELARKWYGARGESHECLMYPSNVYDCLDVPPKKSSTINIQIGNSADPSNEHFEMLEMLKKYRDENIIIYAPLSYGPKDHAYRVKKEGERVFGKKFVAMLDFMPYEEYLRFLGEIDIAMFNHRRQQGMGNTISLLGLGKKVYMRSDVSQWDLFAGLKINVEDVVNFSINEINAYKLNNMNLIRYYFSYKNLISQYSAIFE